MASYSFRQKFPIPVSSGSKVISDVRLPSQAQGVFWSCPDYKNKVDVVLQPEQQYYTSGQTATKVLFRFMTNPDVLVSLEESYLQYKIRIRKGDGTYLTRDDANSGTYCSLGTLTSGGALQDSPASSTCKFIYMKNSACPFARFTVRDRDGNDPIDTIENPGLYSQALLSAQVADFWSTDENVGHATDVAAQVHTFYDPKVTFVKSTNAAATEMIPSGLLPMVSSTVLNTNPPSSGTYYRVFPEVQAQQMVIWPSYNTCSKDDASFIKFYPCSDFMNSKQLIYANLNKLTLEFEVNSYGSAITDVRNTLTTAATSAWAGATSSFGTFELYDIEFHMMTYKVNQDVVSDCLATAQTDAGICVPFVYAKHDVANLPAAHNTLNINIFNPKINDLEKMIIVCRRNTDVADQALYDKFAFRNGSDTEVVLLHLVLVVLLLIHN